MAARDANHAVFSRVIPALLFMLLIGNSATSASVIFDTFDEGGTFDPSSSTIAAYGQRIPTSPLARPAPGPPPLAPMRAQVLTVVRSAAQFTVPAGSAYTLDSITLPIGLNSNVSAAVLRVRLTSDNAGTPGTTLEVLSENQDIWPALTYPFSTTTTLPSALHPALTGGTSYWIVTELSSLPLGPGTVMDYEWFMNTSGTQTIVISQESMVDFPSDPWPTTTDTFPLAFRVEGTSTLSVGSESDGAALALGAPWPNPSSSGPHIDFRLGKPAAVTAQVFDIQGHRVRSLLEDQQLSAGRHELDWDGRNSLGQRVAAGIYLVRVGAGVNTAARRIAVVP